MKIIAPATSANLGPGFDSLGLAIKLYNEVEITKQTFSQISVIGEGANNALLKKNNMFVNIFENTLQTLGYAKYSYRFDFNNSIPLSRGLGSSSAVIILAIVAAYKIAGFNLTKSNLVNLALSYESHPDNIAPCAYGGFCVNVVDKEKVITKKARLDENLRAVIVIPDSKISTSKSRTLLAKNYSRSDCVCNLSHAALMSAAFFSQDYDLLKSAAVDKIHEEVRMSAIPELFKVRELAYQNGALLSTLSGSGSSFLNLTFKENANKLVKVLQSTFTNFRVISCELDNNGYEILS